MGVKLSAGHNAYVERKKGKNFHKRCLWGASTLYRHILTTEVLGGGRLHYIRGGKPDVTGSSLFSRSPSQPHHKLCSSHHATLCYLILACTR